MTATPRPTRRPGLTLTEALVAMFVAAIGLLALLTLFPLGAMQMGQALKDERTSQTAAQADQLMRYYWRAEVADRTGVAGFPDGPDPFVLAFRRPNVRAFRVTNVSSLAADQANSTDPMNHHISAVQNPRLATTPPISIGVYSSLFPRLLPAGTPLVVEPATGSDQPGFPVVIDPLGWHPREGRPYAQLWVGGRDNTYLSGFGYGSTALPLPLPRRTLRVFQNLTPGAYNPAVNPSCSVGPWASGTNPSGFMYNQAGAPSPIRLSSPLRFASLLDDLTYDESGSGVPPTNSTGTGIERQGRYNWMAIVQQPRVSESTTAALTIAVFDGRAPGYAPDGQELIYPRDSGITTGNTPLATQLPNLVVFVPGSTNLRVYYAGEKPPISKGRWVMDGTIGGFPVLLSPNPGAVAAYDPDNSGFATLPANQLSLRHANFYRVASVSEGVDAARNGLTYLDIELEKPIKPRSDGRSVANVATDWTYYAGSLYVLPGVSEVFEMPPLTR